MERLDNAAAHALHSLPPDEAATFERSIADDEYLLEDLESFRRVASELIHGLPDIVPAASPELWDRIGREAGIITSQETPQSVPPDSTTKRTTYFASAAAAVAVLAVAVASMLALRAPASDFRSLAAAAAEQPASTTFSLTNPTGVADMGADVIIGQDGTGYVIADALPTLDPDRTYQLWLVIDDRVVSAGILGNDPTVAQFRAEGDIAGIAISNEIAGGVVVSEVTPVAIWLRDAA